MSARVIRRLVPLLVAVGLVSTVSVGQRFTERTTQQRVEVAGERTVTDEITEPGADEMTVSGGDDRAGAVARVPSRPGLACARGRNGDETDTGVTGDRIRLAATVVKSGVGASFLKEVPIALEAVVNQVNRDGGICGRLLDLKMVDDGWDAARGQQFIRNFISEGVFALAVSPSSEGLDAAIRNGDIARAGIPVVGADGMLISQYTEGWVWPVAASTITAMHVMAKQAADRGAKTFGLVFEKDYHFGVEGASAFRGALQRTFPGTKVMLADVGIESGQPSYKNAVDEFNRACSPCDFVGMLLEPATALQWIRDGGSFGAMGTGGPQPLFVDSFARACGSSCNGMWVWSGYKPPVAPFDAEPAVVRYVNTIRAQKSTVDTSNPFVEGGYLGMQVLVEGLRRVGPDLTRARLRAELDAMRLDIGLTKVLRWAPGNHFANDAVHAFSIVVNAGSFAGWRYEQTGWIRDPWVGMDAPRR